MLVGLGVLVGRSVGVFEGGGVLVGRSVGVLVGRGVDVLVSVGVGETSPGRWVAVGGRAVEVGVNVGVFVIVGVRVMVGVRVTVGVREAVGVRLGVSVDVPVGEAVGVKDRRRTSCAVRVASGVVVIVAVFVGSRIINSCCLTPPPNTRTGSPKLRKAITRIETSSTQPLDFIPRTLLYYKLSSRAIDVGCDVR